MKPILNKARMPLVSPWTPPPPWLARKFGLKGCTRGRGHKRKWLRWYTPGTPHGLFLSPFVMCLN